MRSSRVVLPSVRGGGGSTGMLALIDGVMGVW